MSPEAYEEFVEHALRQLRELKDAHIVRNAVLPGVRQPGHYEIDISVKFSITRGLDIHLIVECKNWARRVDRPVIQKLAQTRDALSAHKAAVISSRGFTKEAVAVAKNLGIALWVLAEKDTVFICFSGHGGSNLKEPAAPVQALSKPIAPSPGRALIVQTELYQAFNRNTSASAVDLRDSILDDLSELERDLGPTLMEITNANLILSHRNRRQSRLRDTVLNIETGDSFRERASTPNALQSLTQELAAKFTVRNDA